MTPHPAPTTGAEPEPMLARLVFLALAIGLILWAAISVWHHAARTGLERLAERAEADVQLAADRLVSVLIDYRETAVLAADHPYVQALTIDDAGIAPDAVSQVLQRFADLAGAQQIYLLSPSGVVLAGPGDAPERLDLTPDILRARQGSAGLHHSVDARTGRRVFSFALPVYAEPGPPTGIVLLMVDVDKIEAPGRGNPVPVWFSDEAGQVFVTNRSSLLYGPPIPARRRITLAGHSLWESDNRDLPAIGLGVSRDLPVIEMTAHVVEDAQMVLRTARVQAVSVALGMIGIGAVMLALWERRRVLARQLAHEAATNAGLEARVQHRTAELRLANEQLLRAQAELVQAGKLAGLGQMSAGLSHELNQPLMAIGSYAENAVLFLERGKPERAAENLTRIAAMSERMGRIIRNLRAFARQEAEPATRVGLISVVESAIEIAEMRLREADVTLHWVRPARPASVYGGEVRLSQVVVNLISNAIDAVQGRPEREIRIDIRPEGETTWLVVEDSGPGIAEPDRIFDPFYSTKEVGSTEGMGLGLSISYGLVQSFGGTLRGENIMAGGAVIGARFSVGLRTADAPPLRSSLRTPRAGGQAERSGEDDRSAAGPARPASPQQEEGQG